MNQIFMTHSIISGINLPQRENQCMYHLDTLTHVISDSIEQLSLAIIREAFIGIPLSRLMTWIFIILIRRNVCSKRLQACVSL